MASGFFYDDRFLEHEPGQGHPERRERLEGTIAHLRRQPWFEHLQPITAAPAQREAVQSVHSDDYIDRAHTACSAGAPYLDVTDVGICERSYDVALLAAGALVEMSDRVARRDLDNGFVLSRPPGHHAEQAMALGFCMFNNVAIAARHLQRAHGIDKVLILDFDVHHGNGTQHSFESDPSVLYVSTHQYPYYPGTGAATETGSGAGSGATLNCPMAAGAGDAEYEQAWREQIIPKIESFAPEMIIVSAGFDAHHDDPLAQVSLTTEFYAWMSQRLMEQADKHCEGRLVSILEGGYDVQALSQCVASHIEVLCGERPS